MIQLSENGSSRLPCIPDFLRTSAAILSHSRLCSNSVAGVYFVIRQ